MVTALFRSSLNACVGIMLTLYVVNASAVTFFEYPALLEVIKNTYKQGKDQLDTVRQLQADTSFQKTQLESMKLQAKSLKDAFGNSGSFRDPSALMSQMQGLYNALSGTSDYASTAYYKLTNQEISKGGAHLPTLQQQASEKLYFSNRQSFVNASESQKDNVLLNRQMAVNQASVSGIALSAEKIHSTAVMKDQINDNLSRAYRAENLRQDVLTNTEALALIANELISIREIQARQLEVISAAIANIQPIYTKTPGGA